MTDLKIFDPKKGDKFWMMYAGKPVEATVLEVPTRIGSGYHSGDWKVSVPGYPEKEWAYFWNMYPTRKECLESHIRDEEDTIERSKEHIKRYQGYIKESKEFLAKWKRMLATGSDEEPSKETDEQPNRSRGVGKAVQGTRRTASSKSAKAKKAKKSS